LDHKVQEWVALNRARILNVQISHSVAERTTSFQPGAIVVSRELTLVYAILYERTSAAIPLKEGARAPTVRANEVHTGRAAQAMAGVFPVPEGYKLHPSDDEPAPVTLLSPDADLTPFKDLFGNIGAYTHE
jgi:hypothetical protein